MDEPRTAAHESWCFRDHTGHCVDGGAARAEVADAVWLGVAIERAVADLRRDGAHTTADDLERAWAARAEVAEPPTDEYVAACLRAAASQGAAFLLGYEESLAIARLLLTTDLFSRAARAEVAEPPRGEVAEPGDGRLAMYQSMFLDVAAKWSAMLDAADKAEDAQPDEVIEALRGQPAATAGREPLDALREALTKAYGDGLIGLPDDDHHRWCDGSGGDDHRFDAEWWLSDLATQVRAALDTPDPGASA